MTPLDAARASIFELRDGKAVREIRTVMGRAAGAVALPWLRAKPAQRWRATADP